MLAIAFSARETEVQGQSYDGPSIPDHDHIHCHDYDLGIWPQPKLQHNFNTSNY